VPGTEESRFGAIRAALPSGTIPVGLGLIVAGLSAYGFQIIAFRILGSEPYAALNGLWVTAFVLAPGLFLPLEQEVARALAHRKALGQGGRPLIKRAIVLGLVLTVGVIILVVALKGPIEGRLLRGSDELFVALIVVLIGFALESLGRGVLSGNGRFGRYGIVVGVDGFARVALAALIAVVGFSTLGWFGVVFAIAPFLATFAGLIGVRGVAEAGPPAPMSELSTAIGWLLLGSTFAQALSYSAYIGASVLATKSQDAELGAFIAGLFIARIPLLLFQAVQAALLPKLASLLGHGRFHDFRIGLTRLVIVVATASVMGVLLALLAGPFIGTKLFGDNFTLSGASLAALTAGCCLVVIALTLAQALIALQHYALTAMAWVVAVGVFVVLMATLSADVFARAEIAFVVAATVAVIWMLIVALWALRHLEVREAAYGVPAA
jgi:O-antigen/teichoic acid export membrane protein